MEPANQYTEHAARIIAQNIYASLATVTPDYGPWNSPVFVVYDYSMNFYWASGKGSQHSKNILDNGKVFLAIYDSKIDWGKGEGVFIQATAEEVTEPAEIEKVCQMRKSRAPKATQTVEDFTGDKPRRIYKAVPQAIWVNVDELDTKGNFIQDQRVEVRLADLEYNKPG